MIRSVSIQFRQGDSSCMPIIRDIVDFLRKKNIRVMLQDDDLLENDPCAGFITGDSEMAGQADLAIAIGGDGTFLRTARLFAESGKPIFGINRGRLGFLTEFSPDEYPVYLEKIISGEYSTVDRIALEAVHFRNGIEGEHLCFLNDAVISKGAFSRAIRLEICIDNKFLNSFSGDGIIVCTATGSTAYSLSAYGPIITPSASQVYLINPVCPHTLAMRPMILPVSSEVRVRIVSELKNLLLTIDGQEAIRIEGNDEVVFRESTTRVRLIPHPEKDYYAILREKLGWGN